MPFIYEYVDKYATKAYMMLWNPDTLDWEPATKVNIEGELSQIRRLLEQVVVLKKGGE